MKLVFICGSLEPGKDGVGDYVYILARELIDLGHTCLLIALNDQFLETSSDSKSNLFQFNSEYPALCTLRFASCTNWCYKSRFLAEEFKYFCPDLISLQYVPYSFQMKGLPFLLLFCLGNVRSLSHWHIMAHELWVDSRSKLRNFILSTFQKFIFTLIVRQLHPISIDVSNMYNFCQVKDLGYPASIVPLFSNIPRSISEINQIRIDSSPAPDEWCFVFFGSIHEEWDHTYFFHLIETAAVELGITVVHIQVLGNAGAYGCQLFESISSTIPSWIHIQQTGWISDEMISILLTKADWGVTTTPSHLLGKSGSVAAMLDHGLQVIVPRMEYVDGPWHSSFINDFRFIPLNNQFKERLLLRQKLSLNNSSTPFIVADHLIHLLQQLS